MSDPVEHPDHYKFDGVEVIQLTEQLSFNRGNAVKYIARAGRKDPETELEDLRKAKFHLEREINRWDNPPTYQVVSQDFWDDIDQAAADLSVTIEEHTGNFLLYNPEPRVWESLNDVPVGIQVTDIDGDEWFGDGNEEDDVWTDKFGPFTEILDAK